jgi:hypothetical protein
MVLGRAVQFDRSRAGAEFQAATRQAPFGAVAGFLKIFYGFLGSLKQILSLLKGIVSASCFLGRLSKLVGKAFTPGIRCFTHQNGSPFVS